MLNIIFGKLPLTCHNKVINFIILSGKQRLFSCFMLNKALTLIGFLGHLKVKLLLFQSLKIQKQFGKQWDIWKDIFDIYLFLILH